MSTAERILNRYIYMFYPANLYWLSCNLKWDTALCRCVDEVELNIASSLFNKLINNNCNCEFEFKNYMDNSLYHMKICDKTCDLSGFIFCDESDVLKVVDCEFHKKSIATFDPSLERRNLIKYDESIIVYLVFCLLKVNRDINLHRSDILKFYFLKNQNAFLQYLLELKKYIAFQSHCEDDSLLFHVQLIEFVLKSYALNEQSDFLGDVFEVFDESFFRQNYQCENNVGNIRAKLIDSVIGYESQKLPILKVNIASDVTIISAIASIATTIKENYNWNLFKTSFINMHKYLREILDSQKRLHETRISKDMNKLKNILQQ